MAAKALGPSFAIAAHRYDLTETRVHWTHAKAFKDGQTWHGVGEKEKG